MLVSATRTARVLTLRGAFYAGLFLVVVMAQVGISSALKQEGWAPAWALMASGAVVLAIVLAGLKLAGVLHHVRAEYRERKRIEQKLPDGPCCVVWRPNAASDDGGDMPWRLVGPLRARYPKLARRLGIEGIAICDFEIGADGAPKNVHCVYAWPSDVFFDAAREALLNAKFAPSGDEHPRFGVSFKMPFVFRIAGAARLKERGRRARPLRPGLTAAGNAVSKMRRSA